MALFRVDFSGRGELSERQQKVSGSILRLAYYSIYQHPRSLLRCGRRLLIGNYSASRPQFLSKLSKLSEEFNASMFHA